MHSILNLTFNGDKKGLLVVSLDSKKSYDTDGMDGISF